MTDPWSFPRSLFIIQARVPFSPAIPKSKLMLTTMKKSSEGKNPTTCLRGMLVTVSARTSAVVTARIPILIRSVKQLIQTTMMRTTIEITANIPMKCTPNSQKSA